MGCQDCCLTRITIQYCGVFPPVVVTHLAFSICFFNQYIPFHVSIVLSPKSSAIDNRNTVSGTWYLLNSKKKFRWIKINETILPKHSFKITKGSQVTDMQLKRSHGNELFLAVLVFTCKVVFSMEYFFKRSSFIDIFLVHRLNVEK